MKHLKKVAYLQHCDLCECAETIQDALRIGCQIAIAITAARKAVHANGEPEFLGYTPSLGMRRESKEKEC